MNKKHTGPVGAIILAAGFSRRFGSSKLLAKLNNKSTVAQQTISRIAAAVDETVVITRPEIAGDISKNQTDIITFENAQLGMGATLAFAVTQIEEWSACLVCLADMPFIKTSTYQQLAHELAPERIIVPRYRSKSGNPVGFGRDFFVELGRLSGDEGGKDIIRRHPEALFTIEVDDEAIVQDIDTPEDLERFSRID